MKTKKILLTTPILSMENLLGKFSEGGGVYLPLGLLSIATYANKYGYNVSIIDNWIFKNDKNQNCYHNCY